MPGPVTVPREGDTITVTGQLDAKTDRAGPGTSRHGRGRALRVLTIRQLSPRCEPSPRNERTGSPSVDVR